jgi:hypothetical protein
MALMLRVVDVAVRPRVGLVLHVTVVVVSVAVGVTVRHSA